MPEFKFSDDAMASLTDRTDYVRDAVDQAVVTLVWSTSEFDGLNNVHIAPQAVFKVFQDISAFLAIEEVWTAITERGLEATDVGHNYYLSANGDGTGFWAHDWGIHGAILHRHAQYKVRDAYLGDDGLVYVS